MPSHPEPVPEPLPPGTTALFHRSWLYDYDEEFGGGYAWGDFLLRDDGILFRQFGATLSQDGHTFRRGPWTEVTDWRGTDADACQAYLHSTGYVLLRHRVLPDE
jgi:hypothetical protein